MTHVVTQACCGDASCVYACPVNCIHPTPDEPDFATTDMLYIDAAACVDCGACAEACPVDAIVPSTRLRDDQLPFINVNALFYQTQRSYPPMAPVPTTRRVTQSDTVLRVAVVGSGPSGMYTADELLKQRNVEVTVFDRLPTPYGLVRSGVAPDHQDTKRITELFASIEAHPRFRYFLNVDVGTDITHTELLEHHHAVIYACGASTSRSLDIPGESLPGSVAATDFVAWYNGHPDHTADHYDLSHRRAVVIGNGNVALDIARILTADPHDLATTDIAPHALSALSRSAITEVEVIARRGVAQAAYTLPELTGLLARDGVDVVADRSELRLDNLTAAHLEAATLPAAALRKIDAVRSLGDCTTTSPTRPSIRLRYLLSATAITGKTRATGLTMARNELLWHTESKVVSTQPTGHSETIDAGLIVRSVGYRGVPVDGLPFDTAHAIIPNTRGRVLDPVDNSQLRGLYVVGWIKRGPTGFIGTNRTCARETVDSVIADFNAHHAAAPPMPSQQAFTTLIAHRKPDAITIDGWRAIDQYEKLSANRHGRPRVKLVERGPMTTIAATPRRTKAPYPPTRKPFTS